MQSGFLFVMDEIKTKVTNWTWYSGQIKQELQDEFGKNIDVKWVIAVQSNTYQEHKKCHEQNSLCIQNNVINLLTFCFITYPFFPH